LAGGSDASAGERLSNVGTAVEKRWSCPGTEGCVVMKAHDFIVLEIRV